MVVASLCMMSDVSVLMATVATAILGLSRAHVWYSRTSLSMTDLGSASTVCSSAAQRGAWLSAVAGLVVRTGGAQATARSDSRCRARGGAWWHGHTV